jgi:hypothetical protein
MTKGPLAPKTSKRMLAAITSLILIAVAIPAIPFAVATSPPAVTFDHLGGNEYWVEVKITSSHPFNYVQVRVLDDRWHGMSQASWDPSGQTYVSGIHIPPGKPVQFAVVFSDWTAQSCFYTHPEGVQRCDITMPDFTATFRAPSGNEWWEQIYVDSNRELTAVWVDISGPSGGTGYLDLRSWGAWAGSFYAPSGSTVRFGAITQTNEVAQSNCYRWPDIVVVTCQEAIVFDPHETRFDHITGNEWWVEVSLSGPQPDEVLARDDGGVWVPLEYKSWGTWAGSFHIEPGHKVQFRFPAGDALWDSCLFTHPQGLAPDGTQQCGTTFVGQSQPVFTHVGGNEWWVEVKVGHTEPTSVVASDDGGASWNTLTKRDWGVWAGSFHIEPGHKVLFRAVVVGTTYQSCEFTHPAGIGPEGVNYCNGSTYF